MATVRQKIVVKKLVENGGNLSKAMRDSGYSEATINNPSNLTESKGFKSLLADSGLTDTLVLSELVSDIKSKPSRRLSELSLACDILGLRKKKLADSLKAPATRNSTNIERDQIYESYLKAKLAGRQSVTIEVLHTV